MLIRVGALVLVASFFLLHCGPLQNICSPGTKGSCLCPDGSYGQRTCQENRRMSACFCNGAPTNQETPKTEAPPTREGAPTEPIQPEFGQEPVSPDTAPESRPDSPQEPTQEPSTEPPITRDAGPTEPGPPETPPADCGTPAQCNMCSPACPPHSQCTSGRCVCAQGRKLCTRYCADIAYDPFHCGACNKTCNSQQACVNRKCQCFFSKEESTFDFGCAFVKSVDFSLDGKYLVAINDNGNKCGAELRVWDARTRKLLHSFKSVTYRPAEVMIFKDNDTLLVRSNARRFYRLSLKQKKGITYIDVPSKSGMNCMAIDPDPKNTFFAVGARDKSFMIMDNVTRKNVKWIKALSGNPTALAYRADARRLAVALESKEVWIYDTTSWQVVKKLQGLTAAPTSVAYNKAGTVLALGQVDSRVSLHDPNTGKALRSILFQGSFVYRVYKVAFTPDGKYIASGWADRSAKIHDVATGRLVHEIGNHRNEVRGLDIAPDGKSIATAAGNVARVWGCRP